MALSDASLELGRVVMAAAKVAFTEGDFYVNGVRIRGGQRTSISLLGNFLFNEGDHQLQIKSQERDFILV